MSNILYSLLGGILIGISSTTMLGGLGRITGISGILSSIAQKPSKDHFWKYTFLTGLIVGAFITHSIRPELFHYQFDQNIFKILIAGFLVGFGTRLGNGCTSGHGVCGIARMAKRSLIATSTFILFGIIFATIEGIIK